MAKTYILYANAPDVGHQLFRIQAANDAVAYHTAREILEEEYSDVRAVLFDPKDEELQEFRRSESLFILDGLPEGN